MEAKPKDAPDMQTQFSMEMSKEGSTISTQSSVSHSAQPKGGVISRLWGRVSGKKASQPEESEIYRLSRALSREPSVKEDPLASIHAAAQNDSLSHSAHSTFGDDIGNANATRLVSRRNAKSKFLTFLEMEQIKNTQKQAKIMSLPKRNEQSEVTDYDWDINVLRTRGKSIWIHDQLWLLNPHSSFLKYWSIGAVFLSLLYTVVRVPYSVAFDVDELSTSAAHLPWFILNRIVDFIFMADIVIIFLTAVVDGDRVLINRTEIAKKYLRSWFLVDLMATIPFDLLIWGISGGGSGFERGAKLLRAAKMNKTLRLFRVLKFQRVSLKIQMVLGINFSVMTILKFICSVLFMGHLLACGFLALSNDDEELEGITNTSSRGTQYITALYWSFQTVTTTGYGDLGRLVGDHRLFAMFAMVFGSIFFMYGVTTAVYTATSMSSQQRTIQQMVQSMQDWANHHMLGETVVSDIRRYFQYKHEREYFEEEQILSVLNVPLKKRVCAHKYGDLITHMKIFECCSRKFLMELMIRLENEFYSPFTKIIEEGTIGDQMFVIKTGECVVYRGKDRQDIRNAIVLNAGQPFGELSMFEPTARRMATVLALDWTDLLSIRRAALLEILKFYPSERRLIRQYASAKLEAWRTLHRAGSVKQSAVIKQAGWEAQNEPAAEEEKTENTAQKPEDKVKELMDSVDQITQALVTDGDRQPVVKESAQEMNTEVKSDRIAVKLPQEYFAHRMSMTTIFDHMVGDSEEDLEDGSEEQAPNADVEEEEELDTLLQPSHLRGSEAESPAQRDQGILSLGIFDHNASILNLDSTDEQLMGEEEEVDGDIEEEDDEEPFELDEQP